MLKKNYKLSAELQWYLHCRIHAFWGGWGQSNVFIHLRALIIDRYLNEPEIDHVIIG